MTSVAFSEEGSCGEEDFDLFKAFLRDSDSDCEDAYYIQPSSASRASFDSGKSCVLQDDLCPLSKGGKHDLGFGLMSPSCRANSSSLLNLSSKLDAYTTPESGSPNSSQGHSSLTSFPSMVSEQGSQEREDQSTFHSVLSMASTSTLFDIESPDDSQDRKRKASWVVMGHPEKKSSSLAESVSSAVAEKSPTPPPALAPLAAAKPCCTTVVGMGQGLPAMSVASGPFVGGSISTGVPVDTLTASPSGPLPFARSPPPVATCPAAWPAYLAPLPGKGMGVIQTPLHSPQAMIPTAPPAIAHYLPPARATPAPPAPSAISTQKIAAALAEMSKLPVGAGPLGLKLDRVGVTNALRGMGVKKLDA